MFHFFFGDVAGSDRAAAVSQYDVKVAAVIADVKDRSIFWNIFFSNHGDFGSGNPQDKFENSLNDTKRTDFFRLRWKLSDDPFDDQNGNGKNKKTDYSDRNKYKPDHDKFLFLFILQYKRLETAISF